MRGAPVVLEAHPEEGARDLDPSRSIEATLRFNHPLDTSQGRAVLEWDDAQRELTHAWEDDGRALVVPLDGQLGYGIAYRLRLEGYVDDEGRALDTFDVLGDDALDFTTMPSPDVTPPEVTGSSPAQGEQDVYPAALCPQGMCVRLVVRFDEPMDVAQTSVLFGAHEGVLEPLEGRFEEGGLAFVLELRSPPFLSAPPLQDDTEYALDLRALVDEAGNPLEPSVHLEDGLLRFRTGRYDPLLNHACGHVAAGPFKSEDASLTKNPLAPRTDVGHTRYTVRLHGDAPYVGYTRMRATVTGTRYLFLDGDLAIALETLDGEPVDVERYETPRACEGITHALTFEMDADDELYLTLGPQAEAESRFIVEVVQD